MATAVTRGERYPIGIGASLPGGWSRATTRAEWTGETRPPLAGEWYLSGAIIEAYQAGVNMSTPHHIAKIKLGRYMLVFDDDGQHVTRILPRDIAGHWAWECDLRDGDGSGYETAPEVLAAATAHGPLAADSLRPVDDDES